MAKIKLDWSGATSIPTIQGYEIEGKLSSSGTYLPIAFVSTTNTFGTYTWTGANFGTTYDFRIRTLNTDSKYSPYKLLNTVSTTPAVNNPPTAPSGHSVNSITSSSIQISFSGATDDWEIKGYEVSFKLSSSGTWTIRPFITTTNSGFTTTITGLSSSTSYDIRVRTRDVFDVWSTTYRTVTGIVTLSGSFEYFRSSTGQNTSLGLITDACPLSTSNSNEIYVSEPIQDLGFGDVIYTNSGLTTPFNGNGLTWKIGDAFGLINYVATINNSGVIQNIVNCDF